MNNTYAVIDTNVLVSAMLKTNSNPFRIILEALIGKITPLVNREILAEYNEVLRRKKFQFSEEAIQKVIEGIAERAINIEGEPLEDLLPDPKDVIFYEVVMEARKSTDAYLITGNIRHFPNRTYIVTPAEMLDILNS